MVSRKMYFSISPHLTLTVCYLFSHFKFSIHVLTYTFKCNHFADAFMQSNLQMRTIEIIKSKKEQQNESAMTSPMQQTNPRFHRQCLNLVLDQNVSLSCFNWKKLAPTDLKIDQCLWFVSRCTPVMFIPKHIYKKYLNVLIELWPNPGLV